MHVEEWHLYDCIARSAPMATDPEGAAGMSVNRAWRAFHSMGNDHVLVAYLEGGVNWRKPDTPHGPTSDRPSRRGRDGTSSTAMDGPTSTAP